MSVRKTWVGIAGIAMGVCAYGAGNYADTVVYGTIRTAETANPVAEALAVKRRLAGRPLKLENIGVEVREVLDMTGSSKLLGL